MEIARYEKRVGGWAIDKACSLAVFGGMIAVFHLCFGAGFSIYYNILLSLLIAYAFYVFSVSFFAFATKGASFGMLLVGIKSIRGDGERLSFRAIFLKALLNGMVALDLVNCFYMLLVHTERSAFDRLTSSLVIDTRA